MSAGEGGESRVGVAARQLGLRLGMVDLAAQARLKPEIGRIGLVAADTFCAIVARTVAVLAWRGLDVRWRQRSTATSLLCGSLFLSLARLLPQSHLA